MRKLFAAGFVGVALIAAACAPTKPPPPPPPPPPNVDVLLLGDSVGFGVGCILGHNGGEPQTCPPPAAPVQPTFSTYNGYLGACAVSQGWIQLYDRTAIEGNCNNPGMDYTQIWPAGVDIVDPELVVIVTGGWEIVDRWDDSFPAGINCALTATLNCDAADRQWAGAGAFATNAIANYTQHMTNAITQIRARPSNPEVLVLSMPYVDPQCPSSGVWWEPHGAQPDGSVLCPPIFGGMPNDYNLPNQNTPYRPSKAKIDAFNATVQAVVSSFALPDEVQFFDFWDEFSPGNEFSTHLCPYPNNKEPVATTCPATSVLVRDIDRSHLNEAGNSLLGQSLIPKVQQMLAP